MRGYPEDPSHLSGGIVTGFGDLKYVLGLQIAYAQGGGVCGCAEMGALGARASQTPSHTNMRPTTLVAQTLGSARN